MKTKLKVDTRNLPARSPIGFALLLYLAFDKWNVPEWVYGAVGFLILLWLIAFIVDRVNSKSINLFDDWDVNVPTPAKKSKFQQRLDELKNKPKP